MKCSGSFITAQIMIAFFNNILIKPKIYLNMVNIKEDEKDSFVRIKDQMAFISSVIMITIYFAYFAYFIWVRHDYIKDMPALITSIIFTGLIILLICINENGTQLSGPDFRKNLEKPSVR